MKDEPYWHALSGLASWAQDKAIPSVWSCLAAHAAVLQLEGIERQRLGSKLSGVFDCHIDSASHEIVHGTPAKWRVPHSRLYGLSEELLQSHGYSILSWSPDTGADIFMKQTDSLSLFFQGHPEYSSAALLGEYRRDIRSISDGRAGFLPPDSSRLLQRERRSRTRQIPGASAVQPQPRVNEGFRAACNSFRPD